MNTSNELTIAICTHNRPDLLQLLLGRILPQAEQFGVWVIVVDSASEPAAARRVMEGVASSPVAHLIRLDRKGTSLARNAALNAASTPWLAFIDDDELPPPDWVKEALELCRRLPADCAACGGNTLPLWPEGLEVPRIGQRWLDYLSLVERQGELDQSDRPHFLIGHSMVRVSAVREVGGFDLRLGRQGSNLLSGEESLLVEMLIAKGWRIWHSDRLNIQHAIEPERLERGWVRNRAYWEGVTRARILRLSDPVAHARLAREVTRKAIPLKLLARGLGRFREVDLRWCFAAGVLAERKLETTSPNT